MGYTGLEGAKEHKGGKRNIEKGHRKGTIGKEHGLLGAKKHKGIIKLIVSQPAE